MPNTRYRAGRDLEYAAKNDLEVNGYITFRTAGSHGAADVIALKGVGGTFARRETLLVQCKTGGALGPAERTELYNLAALIGATPILARWHKEGNRARQVWYTELIGTDRDSQRAWTPDHAFTTCMLCPDVPELGRCAHQKQDRRATA
jgi:hypothetical protein